MAPGSGGLPLGLQIAGRRFEDDLVLRAAAAWERAQPWETASLAPAPPRPLPAELAAALAAGARVATIPGIDAWSLDAPVRAGELFALGDGRRAARGARLEPAGGRAGGLLPGRAVSADPGASERRARRAEICAAGRCAGAALTGAALLVAVAGIGIWAAATLASGRDDEPRSTRRRSPRSPWRDGSGHRDGDDDRDDDDGRARRRPGSRKRSVTIAWVGDTVLASSYGTPPDGGRHSMAPVVGAAAQRRPGLRQPRGDALAAARLQVRRLVQLLRVPGAAVVRARA